MSEIPAESVKVRTKKPPVISCQVTEEFRDEVDGLRDLFVEMSTPDGRASRSAVMRSVLQQGKALLDRKLILAVRAIAKRDGTEVSDAWRKVIVAGIAADGKTKK